MKNNRGFTLIETVVYIALLALIVGGALAVSYGLIEGARGVSVDTALQDEGSFVLRKINWALTGASSVSTGGSGCNQTLSVTRYSGGANFRLNSGRVELDSGEGYLPLTTENASTTCLRFVLLGSNPMGVAATTTINGLDFAITKYLRK